MTFFQKAKRFFEPLKEQKLLVFFSCIKFSTGGIFAIASVLIIKATLGAVEKGNPELLTKYIYWYFIFFIVYLAVAWIFRATDWPKLYHRTEKWLYRKYLPNLIYADNNYIERIGTGRIIATITQGVKTWIDQMSFLIREVIKVGITGIFLFYLLAQIDWRYALLVFGMLFVMHIAVVLIDIRAHRFRKIRTEQKHELTRQIVRMVMSKSEIMQNNSLQKELAGISRTVDVVAYANDNINKSLFGIFNLVRVVTMFLRIGVLMIVGYGVFDRTYSVADFATTMAMIIVFEGFLFDSTEFYKNFTKEFSDIEKLWETLGNAPRIHGFDQGKEFKMSEANIIISNISYGYNEKKVFEDFSLTIEKGKKTALVGASGGGKTTLMKLIAGYLHPEKGTISVLGNDLSETALRTYYPHIGYLTQDPSVFDGTIRENLISAIAEKKTDTQTDTQRNQSNVPETTNKNSIVSSVTVSVSQDEMLVRALKLAHCDFVFELEKGLDTEIGERGVRLSGGQKQRLAIAKIFLKDPAIILLDEPTSALDSFSEEQITKALDTLFQNRTVIIIAHRLQTVKKADTIIVIEGGQVQERGTHGQLLQNKDGIYSKMLELQSGF